MNETRTAPETDIVTDWTVVSHDTDGREAPTRRVYRGETFGSLASIIRLNMTVGHHEVRRGVLDGSDLYASVPFGWVNVSPGGYTAEYAPSLGIGA